MRVTGHEEEGAQDTARGAAVSKEEQDPQANNVASDLAMIAPTQFAPAKPYNWRRAFAERKGIGSSCEGEKEEEGLGLHPRMAPG